MCAGFYCYTKNTMLFLSIMHHYVFWHYTRAWKELFHVWSNLIWFVINFFSLPQMMLSWLSPWKRMTEGRGDKWNLEDLASYVIIGIISRIVGAIMRTVVIFIGLICLAIVITGGIMTILFWAIAPLVIIGFLGFGLTLLIA